jgi:hypothetical protein
MDQRMERAQELYWLVYGAGTVAQPGRLNELVEMAQLHEDIARERFGRDDANGWMDLYSAVTTWGDAGRLRHARALISEARQWAGRFPAMQRAINRELLEHERWLDKKLEFLEIEPLIRSTGWNSERKLISLYERSPRWRSTHFRTLLSSSVARTRIGKDRWDQVCSAGSTIEVRL